MSEPQGSLLGRLSKWNRQNPALWVSVVTFFASCLFAYAFARVAHWTNGAGAGKLITFCAWDCGWYSHTIADGYDLVPHLDTGHNAANWAFFPLFPITGKIFSYLLHLDSGTAAVLTSKVEFLVAIFAFVLWLRPHLENTAEYFLAAAIVAFNPYLIYGHAGYSEPLYFALCCFGFWALEREKWIVAGAMGACLSATRMVGLVFGLVYAIAALRQLGARGILRDRSLRILLGLVLCPLGLALFAIYLHHHTGDALAFAHVQTAWGRSNTNPIAVMVESWRAHGWSRVWTCTALAGLVVSAWLARRRVEYGIFLAISILLPWSSGLAWGFPRYLWWQPPLLFAIYLWLRRSVPAQIAYFAFAEGMASFMVVAWFSGTNIVV